MSGGSSTCSALSRPSARIRIRSRNVGRERTAKLNVAVGDVCVEPAPIGLLEEAGGIHSCFRCNPQYLFRIDCVQRLAVKILERVLEWFPDGLIDFRLYGLNISRTCQAGDEEGDEATCFSEDAELLDMMRATGDYSFVTFSWNEDGDCTRIGFSTQSFYLPYVTTRGGSN